MPPPDLGALAKRFIASAHQHAIDEANCRQDCTFSLTLHVGEDRPSMGAAYLRHGGRNNDFVFHGHVILAPTDESVADALRQAEPWMQGLWHDRT